MHLNTCAVQCQKDFTLHAVHAQAARGYPSSAACRLIGCISAVSSGFTDRMQTCHMR